MDDITISNEKLKAVFSVISTAFLAIQHFVGLFADKISISYIPLTVTFFTIYIGSMGRKELRLIRYVSCFAGILILLSGVIIYTIFSYHISLQGSIYNCYLRIMFFCIGVLSLFLGILYVKRVVEIK